MTRLWTSVAQYLALAASTGKRSPETCDARHWSIRALVTSISVEKVSSI